MAKRKKQKLFIADAWIHPKSGGGDDIPVRLKFKASNLGTAKDITKKWLRKRSAIDHDFRIKAKK